jgi:hypothetical protein
MIAGGDSGPRTAEEPREVVIVERSDPDGMRWNAALDLLLEAGRAQEDEA